MEQADVLGDEDRARIDSARAQLRQQANAHAETFHACIKDQHLSERLTAAYARDVFVQGCALLLTPADLVNSQNNAVLDLYNAEHGLTGLDKVELAGAAKGLAEALPYLAGGMKLLSGGFHVWQAVSEQLDSTDLQQALRESINQDKALFARYWVASDASDDPDWEGFSQLALGIMEHRSTICEMNIAKQEMTELHGMIRKQFGQFSVGNRPPQIAELTTEGLLLRVIELEGAKDPEGITYVQEDTYVISDEHSHSMYWVQIGPDTQRVSITGRSSLGIRIDSVHNSSFEGVSWDSEQNRLFVVKEKMPLRVLVIKGLDVFNESTGFNIDISEWKSSSAASLFMSDLSSLTLHEPTGHLLLLSDESALVVEYAPDGQPISVLPLWRGFNGLQHKVPQPEGLAVGPDGALYVLSEPNLFYRFERGQKTATSSN